MTKTFSVLLTGGVVAVGLGLGVLAQQTPPAGGQQAGATRTMEELFVQAAAAGNAFEVETSRLAGDRASSPSVKRYAQSMIEMHTKAQTDLNAASTKGANARTPSSSGTGNGQTGAAPASGATAGPSAPGASTGNNQNGNPNTASGVVAPNVQEPPSTVPGGRVGSQTADNQTRGAAPSMIAMLSPGEQIRVMYLSSLKGAAFDRAYIAEQVNAHEGAVIVYRMASQRLTETNLKAFATKSLPMIQQHLQQATKIAPTLR
jgi:predicted outer membrane protein